jgi:hypothetical protein
MAQEQVRSTPLVEVDSPLAWTFPAGFLLLGATIICLVVFVLYPRSSPLACEMKLRTALTFAIPAGVGGLLTPMALALLSPLIRGVSAAVAGALAAALAWAAAAHLFPAFC